MSPSFHSLALLKLQAAAGTEAAHRAEVTQPPAQGQEVHAGRGGGLRLEAHAPGRRVWYCRWREKGRGRKECFGECTRPVPHGEPPAHAAESGLLEPL